MASHFLALPAGRSLARIYFTSIYTFTIRVSGGRGENGISYAYRVCPLNVVCGGRVPPVL